LELGQSALGTRVYNRGRVGVGGECGSEGGAEVLLRITIEIRHGGATEGIIVADVQRAAGHEEDCGLVGAPGNRACEDRIGDSSRHIDVRRPEAADVHGLAELQAERGVHRNVGLTVLHTAVDHIGRGEVRLRGGCESRCRGGDAVAGLARHAFHSQRSSLCWAAKEPAEQW